MNRTDPADEGSSMELFPEFNKSKHFKSPLADRMRPKGWDDFLGHEHLVGRSSPLRLLIEKDADFSFILWGPPGTGKTTFARIIARITSSRFHELSAVNAGVKDIRAIIDLAEKDWKQNSLRTVIFIDEIHRFNKGQQDAVLPYLENGVLRLIGSTTENPSFEVIPALRSRCQVFRMGHLTHENIHEIIVRAIRDPESGLNVDPALWDDEAVSLIVRYANGDARKALNTLEASHQALEKSEEQDRVNTELIEAIIQQVSVLYDKLGNEHFDHASAYQKSMRGSDPDATIYWLAKMISGGEDPKFIARRLLVTAAEDVGLKDPNALLIAKAAFDSVEKLGLPEARIVLSMASLYVAKAPKDNATIKAIDNALGDIEKRGLSFPVPNHLKDSHYADAKRFGFGKDYKYPHDYPGHVVDQNYLPDELKGKKYFFPDDSNL